MAAVEERHRGSRWRGGFAAGDEHFRHVGHGDLVKARLEPAVRQVDAVNAGVDDDEVELGVLAGAREYRVDVCRRDVVVEIARAGAGRRRVRPGVAALDVPDQRVVVGPGRRRERGGRLDSEFAVIVRDRTARETVRAVAPS